MNIENIKLRTDAGNASLVTKSNMEYEVSAVLSTTSNYVLEDALEHLAESGRAHTFSKKH